MRPKHKSVETRYMEERNEFFQALKSLDRRSFIKVSAAALGAAAARGIVPPHFVPARPPVRPPDRDRVRYPVRLHLRFSPVRAGRQRSLRPLAAARRRRREPAGSPAGFRSLRRRPRPARAGERARPRRPDPEGPQGPPPGHGRRARLVSGPGGEVEIPVRSADVFVGSQGSPLRHPDERGRGGLLDRSRNESYGADENRRRSRQRRPAAVHRRRRAEAVAPERSRRVTGTTLRWSSFRTRRSTSSTRTGISGRTTPTRCRRF